jgi:hypothetical protein
MWVTNYSEDLKTDSRFVAAMKEFATAQLQLHNATKEEETLLQFFKIVIVRSLPFCGNCALGGDARTRVGKCTLFKKKKKFEGDQLTKN